MRRPRSAALCHRAVNGEQLRLVLQDAGCPEVEGKRGRTNRRPGRRNGNASTRSIRPWLEHDVAAVRLPAVPGNDHGAAAPRPLPRRKGKKKRGAKKKELKGKTGMWTGAKKDSEVRCSNHKPNRTDARQSTPIDHQNLPLPAPSRRLRGSGSTPPPKTTRP